MIHGLSRRQFVLGAVHGAAAAALTPLLAEVEASPGSSASDARRGRAQYRDLETLIPDLMKSALVPGVSMAFIKDAAVVWHRGFGVRDAVTGGAVDEHTMFEAASVSKTVFARAVMLLCDRGVMSLDAPLTKYTTERILEGDPRLDLITARHVLSHTSGLPNFRSRAEPLRIHFTPGERFLYSGEGYWYLQSIITRLAGRTDARACGQYEAGLEVCASDIASYLETNVLVPLQMKASSYTWKDAFEPHVARPHDGAGKPLSAPKPTAVDAARYAAMGGLRTTALDYAKFLMETLAPRASGPFRLSTSMRQEMLRPHVNVDKTKEWALGWQIEHLPGGDLFQHQGGHRGTQAFASASLDRRSGYVILTNSDNGHKVFYDERFVSLVNRLVLG